MKGYLALIEVAESGELQSLSWDPDHLMDGRVILVIDEPKKRIWVWLGRATSVVQRTTALRQTRFILRNGFKIQDITVGAKCTEFVEVTGESTDSRIGELRELFKAHPKEDALFISIGVEAKPEAAIAEAFQKRLESFDAAIALDPSSRSIRAKSIRTTRRLLSYEEQLAGKVLFAAVDVCDEASITSRGPSEFIVRTSRLLLHFFCQSDDILFSLFQAATTEDAEQFIQAFGQQPIILENGEYRIDPSFVTEPKTEEPPSPAATPVEPVSVTDKMRKQLSETLGDDPARRTGESAEPAPSKPKEEQEDAVETGDDYELFDG
ncbi:MAG: hypothetical protein ACFFCO_11960 [Promethearchaeota archaeon]